jgi:Putative auto-transporter adhesin, head GIN domain
MRTNTAIVFAWALLLAAFATGCGNGNTEVGGISDKDQAQLEIKGSPGIEFSGSCTIGDEESTKIGGEVPKSFTYDLKGRALDCEISSDSDLQVELSVGESTHSVQRISGGTLNLTYKDGSISTVTSSSSRSSGRGWSFSSSQVTSSAGTSTQEPNSKTNEPSKVTKESRNIGGFKDVELRGIGNLSIEQTGSESLTVEAEEDVIPKLTTRVVDDRLIIGPEHSTIIHTTKPIDYKLTVKDLKSLEVLGSANVQAEGISTHRLAVTISGAGNVRTGGKADQQEINISGSGTYRAEDLESKEVKINVAGAGSAIVNVSKELDAEISGVGSVEYIGDPTVKQDVIGAGKVSKH